MGYQQYVKDEFFFFSRINPNLIQYRPYVRKIIKELRKMGHEQIMNRIKLLKEGCYVATDLLSIALKESGKYKNKFL